ncbi:MAG: hypothetical protein ABSF98_03620 [Bryobacteraceae bacterium]|jgi:hypothetical protein
MKLLIGAALVTSLAAAQVSMVVTAETQHGATSAQIDRRDVMVWQDNQRRQVLDWVPLRGDQAALQLYILIDDALPAAFSDQFGDLRQFIASQPATTEIGVGYLHFGTVQIAQAPTADHDGAARAFRVPLSAPGESPSPYLSLSELIGKKWPASNARREVLMISSGVDLEYGQADLDDPYLNSAIADAQRAGVIVYTIYWGDARGVGRGLWSTSMAQSYLTLLTGQTGGESWFEGLSNPVSLQPFLKDLNARLCEQYRVTFATSGKAGLKPVRVTTEVPGVKLVAPRKA